MSFCLPALGFLIHFFKSLHPNARSPKTQKGKGLRSGQVDVRLLMIFLKLALLLTHGGVFCPDNLIDRISF